jgi:carbamoyl-phosphate synthase large subunit
MINTLFTSAGRRVELLRSFRQAYTLLELTGNIIALDIDPLAPALHIADRSYIVPRIDSPDYIPSLIEICRRERVDLIFPLIDPEIPILASHRETIESTGARLAAVSVEGSRITADKWLTTQFFKRIGLPTPNSWLPDQLSGVSLDYPVFIKPRRGSASKHTYKVHNSYELEFFINYVTDPIIQEFIHGPEITSDVICSLEGELLGVVSRQRIEVRGGEVVKGVTVYNPSITEACIAIARTLPAIGPITVQCMMSTDEPRFTEINARLGGGIPLGIAAEANSPRWLLAKAAGLSVGIPPIGTYRTGLYMTRFDDCFTFTGDQREKMASSSL